MEDIGGRVHVCFANQLLRKQEVAVSYQIDLVYHIDAFLVHDLATIEELFLHVVAEDAELRLSQHLEKVEVLQE